MITPMGTVQTPATLVKQSVETRSVRPCFETTNKQPTTSNLQTSVPKSPMVESSRMNPMVGATPTLKVNKPHVLTSTIDPRNEPSASVPVEVHKPHPNSVTHPTLAHCSVTSGVGIMVGGSVTIAGPSTYTNSPTAVVRPAGNIGGSVLCNVLDRGFANSQNPFVLKFKTNLIKVCQSCRKNYDGSNDTMGLVVARAERRIVSNLATGTQFLGRESNSHYHAHMN